MPIGVPKVPYQIPGQPYSDWIDIYNRLYRERIIFLGRGINDGLANQIVAVMLYLDSEDPDKPIYLYINSLGDPGFAGPPEFTVLLVFVCISAHAQLTPAVAATDRGARPSWWRRWWTRRSLASPFPTSTGAGSAPPM